MKLIFFYLYNKTIEIPYLHDIESVIIELHQKGVENPLNHILAESKRNIKNALDFEDNIFDDFDLGQDDERNEKVIEFICNQKYQ